MKFPTLSIVAILLFIATGASASPPDDQKTVADLDTQYQAAVKANHVSTMDSILLDDFILVEGDGSVHTKADLLNEAKSKKIAYEHQEELEQKVRIWGNTAVVTAKLWGKGTDAGKPFHWVLWFSDTYVRTPQGWRYAFGQASLPLPKASAHRANFPSAPPRPQPASWLISPSRQRSVPLANSSQTF